MLAMEHGPFGRLDRRPLAFYQNRISLHVGACSGQLVRPKWTTFSRRGRGIVVTLDPESRRYLYQVTGFSRPLPERQDRTPVAALGGVTGDHTICESADPVDAVLALLLFAAVPVGATKAQA